MAQQYKAAVTHHGLYTIIICISGFHDDIDNGTISVCIKGVCAAIKLCVLICCGGCL